MESPEKTNGGRTIRVVCPKLVIIPYGSGLQWLIGSPFLPTPLAIVSTFRCLHTLPPPNSSSPDYHQESEELGTLLLKGFHVIGALIVGNEGNLEKTVGEAVSASRKMRKLLSSYDFGGEFENQEMIGAVADPQTRDICFFISKSENSNSLEAVTSVIYEDQAEKCVWDRGCLLRCELPIRFPFYMPMKSSSNAEETFLRANEAVVSKFKDPNVTFMIEMLNENSEEVPRPVIIRGVELDYDTSISNDKLLGEAGQTSNKKLLCSYFSSKSKPVSSLTSVENADILEVGVLLNKSENSPKSVAPAAEYLPALEETRLLIIDYKLEVICYVTKELPLVYVISKLIIPSLVDQLNRMKKAILPNLLMQPQLRPYHFCPPGMLHPVTVIYELSYGETEMKQVEVRRSLHLRLGLPLDRPLLRIANTLSFAKDSRRSSLLQKGPSLLKDVHTGIPRSGVSGGSVSLVQGSYEYYHYLQDSYDDSGWGCAYRSLQTIISWFRLQHYTSIDVPSHRDIQESLVAIGDKDPSFIGSREWIGAIELSFVLDKLLGVSCKVINVRSGAELPEKCRELALHFETQGTPIMIGGGVLAYTLLGIDYNEASGDCAFLILDPHYTGNDDIKKIVNGGWCGWKKAVDSKGRNFFLHDKFYNLLLPQRPDMV